MSIEAKYSVKRAHFKDKHYWSIVKNKEGKTVGKSRWHGSNVKAERKTIHRMNQQRAKEFVTKENLRKNDYYIPRKIEMSEDKVRFQFEYVVHVFGIKDGEKIDQLMTVVNRVPMTKERIDAKIHELIEYYHWDSITRWYSERLYIREDSRI